MISQRMNDDFVRSFKKLDAAIDMNPRDTARIWKCILFDRYPVLKEYLKAILVRSPFLSVNEIIKINPSVGKQKT